MTTYHTVSVGGTGVNAIRVQFTEVVDAANFAANWLVNPDEAATGTSITQVDAHTLDFVSTDPNYDTFEDAYIWTGLPGTVSILPSSGQIE